MVYHSKYLFLIALQDENHNLQKNATNWVTWFQIVTKSGCGPEFRMPKENINYFVEMTGLALKGLWF